jgi:hypothetical protein
LKDNVRQISRGLVTWWIGLQAGEEFAVVVGEVGVGEEVGAVGEGFGEGGLTTPAADGEVVAVAEGFGDGCAEEVGGTGVVGVVEEAGGGVGAAGDVAGCGGIGRLVSFAKGFVAGAIGVAEDAGEEADDGVDEDGGGELAAREDIVANGELFVAEELGDALIDAFVAAADEDDAVEGGEAAGRGLGEGLALGGEEDNGFFGGVARGLEGEVEGFEGFVDGLGLQDHAFAAAEGAVVYGAVAVVGEVAEVEGVGAGQPRAKGPRNDAKIEWAAKKVGKDGEDVEAHKGRR